MPDELIICVVEDDPAGCVLEYSIWLLEDPAGCVLEYSTWLLDGPVECVTEDPM